MGTKIKFLLSDNPDKLQNSTIISSPHFRNILKLIKILFEIGLETKDVYLTMNDKRFQQNMPLMTSLVQKRRTLIATHHPTA